jgi:AraC-like DNA-binding protein
VKNIKSSGRQRQAEGAGGGGLPEDKLFRHFLAYVRARFPATARPDAGVKRLFLRLLRQADHYFQPPVSDGLDAAQLERAMASMRERFRAGTLEPRGQAAPLLRAPTAAHRARADRAKREREVLDVARFERAMQYMRENFRTATLVDCAAAAGCSPFHFHRRFTEWAGRTPKEIMTGLQVEHAKGLMLEGGIDLPEIARRSGFAHQSHFTARFGLVVGTTPRRWLKARQIEALAAMTATEPQKTAA